MKKRIIETIISLVVISGLTACRYEHQWQDETCIEPKTCSECEEKEGEALRHQWIEADYENPKTCSVCGTTEGEPIVKEEPITEELIISYNNIIDFYETNSYDNEIKYNLQRLYRN